MSRQRSRRIDRGLEPWHRREVGGAPYWLLASAFVVFLGILAVVFAVGPGRPLLDRLLTGG
jgi:hypothetical protein